MSQYEEIVEERNHAFAELNDISHFEKCRELANLLEHNLLSQDLKVSMLIAYARKVNYEEGFINELVHNRIYSQQGLKNVLGKIPPLDEIWLKINKNKSDLLDCEVINLLYYFLIVNNRASIREVQIEDPQRVLERSRQCIHIFQISQTNTNVYETVIRDNNLEPVAAYYDIALDNFFEILCIGAWDLESILLRNEVFTRARSSGNGWEKSLLGSSIQTVGVVRYAPVIGKFVHIQIKNEHYVRVLDTELANVDYIVVYKEKRTGFMEACSKFGKWCVKNKMLTLLGAGIIVLAPFCVSNPLKSGFINKAEKCILFGYNTIYSVVMDFIGAVPAV